MDATQRAVTSGGLVGIMLLAGGAVYAADHQMSYEVGTPLPATSKPAHQSPIKNQTPAEAELGSPTAVTHLDPYPTAGGLEGIAVKDRFDIPSDGKLRDPVKDGTLSDDAGSGWIPEQSGVNVNGDGS